MSARKVWGSNLHKDIRTTNRVFLDHPEKREWLRPTISYYIITIMANQTVKWSLMSLTSARATWWRPYTNQTHNYRRTSGTLMDAWPHRWLIASLRFPSWWTPSCWDVRLTLNPAVSEVECVGCPKCQWVSVESPIPDAPCMAYTYIWVTWNPMGLRMNGWFCPPWFDDFQLSHTEFEKNTLLVDGMFERNSSRYLRSILTDGFIEAAILECHTPRDTTLLLYAVDHRIQPKSLVCWYWSIIYTCCYYKKKTFHKNQPHACWTLLDHHQYVA